MQSWAVRDQSHNCINIQLLKNLLGQMTYCTVVLQMTVYLCFTL